MSSDQSRSKINFFNQLNEKHAQQQLKNVFSNNWEQIKSAEQNKKDSPSNSDHQRAKLVYDEEKRLLVAKHDLSYGVTTNEKSFKRGVKANSQIHSEVVELCQIIEQFGTRLTQSSDSQIGIRFKNLFNIYVAISNKLVGLLLRARKHGYVDFPGEILFQTRDDHVLITLIKSPGDSS